MPSLPAPIYEPDTLLTVTALADAVGVPHAQARGWVLGGEMARKGVTPAKPGRQRLVGTYSLVTGRRLAKFLATAGTDPRYKGLFADVERMSAATVTELDQAAAVPEVATVHTPDSSDVGNRRTVGPHEGGQGCGVEDTAPSPGRGPAT